MRLNLHFDLLLMSSFLGRHWEEKVTSSQNHLEDPCLGCLDHHPGHPGFATPRLSVFIWPGLCHLLDVTVLLLRIVANIQLYTWFGHISTQVVMSKGLKSKKVGPLFYNATHSHQDSRGQLFPGCHLPENKLLCRTLSCICVKTVGVMHLPMVVLI